MNATPLRLEPHRTAILAVDFQPEIMGADGAFAPMFQAEVQRTNLIARAGELLDTARTAGSKIVYSRAAFQPGYTDLVANFPLFHHIAESGILIDGTPATEILDEVAPHEHDVILTHPRVNCFHATSLDHILRGAGIDTVVLSGVATNLAVESTTRAGADFGYRMLVASDACSTNSSAVHDAALASLTMFAEITTVPDLLAAFAGTAAPASRSIVGEDDC
jgi:biuret amidohydrolase